MCTLERFLLFPRQKRKCGHFGLNGLSSLPPPPKLQADCKSKRAKKINIVVNFCLLIGPVEIIPEKSRHSGMVGTPYRRAQMCRLTADQKEALLMQTVMSVHFTDFKLKLIHIRSVNVPARRRCSSSPRLGLLHPSAHMATFGQDRPSFLGVRASSDLDVQTPSPLLLPDLGHVQVESLQALQSQDVLRMFLKQADGIGAFTSY
ncbi:hypothetical protein CCH79_00013925 [Gambusia affinis]|uniref:Uncharacterized protein n=1 Tax=Gambusia affinis TaxID=33528 RepID=A0A315W062_GAMAF|nr:hypothetical protein CCH79_00013925 [Gambusia affinis]